MPSNIAIQLAALSHSAVIELYELDATAQGGAVWRWHNGTNGLGGSVIWQGNTFMRMPIEASGFASKSDGPMPRPRLRVSNVGGLVGALVRQYQGLKGAKLKRKRTLARYLDAVNYPGGVNASADPATHYPDELWIVDRQAERNKAMAEFELASPMDLAGVMLPRRQVVQGFCPWAYRGPDCGYTGAAVARADDSATTNMGEDDCGKRLSSCKLRQWPNRELAFGGFPGVGVLRNV